MKKVISIFVISLVIGVLLLVAESFQSEKTQVVRNPSGQGKHLEELEVLIEGEKEKQSFQLQVEEQQYSDQEIDQMFIEVLEKLDGVVLGKNESFDRVERDLQLVSKLEEYPLEINWALDSYVVMSPEGRIRKDRVTEEGTKVEIRGTITYLEKEQIYVRNAMVYPLTLEGMELVLYEIEKTLMSIERNTRKEEQFLLPEEVNGLQLTWSGKKNLSGLYVIFLGVTLSAYLIYRERERYKKEKINRHTQLLREYPGMLSKLTMLLGTGMTVKHAWEIVVRNYEEQKVLNGTQFVYEEMAVTLHEMQSGVAEGEAYERFGKRCELTAYMKFGAMLSQNLRKGSRGISDLLRVEAIQSFENRKSIAKKQGEEAGTKLLIPMMGMLAVVMIMVMVPAFLTMQV